VREERRTDGLDLLAGGAARVVVRQLAGDAQAHEGAVAHRAVVGAAHAVADPRVDAPEAQVRRHRHRRLHLGGLAA
jgi:hypothetical protein